MKSLLFFSLVILLLNVKCFDDSDSNNSCPNGQYYARETGDCQGAGSCVAIPEVCTTEYDPVCGCDNKTYTNACNAASKGMNIKSMGECD